MIDNVSLLKNRLMDLASHSGRSMQANNTMHSRDDAPMRSENARRDLNDAEMIDTTRTKARKEELKKELVRLSQDLNKEMMENSINVNFRYNDDIEGLVVVVRREDSEKIVREIPSKEAIELMKKMSDIVGMIFDKKV